MKEYIKNHELSGKIRAISFVVLSTLILLAMNRSKHGGSTAVTAELTGSAASPAADLDKLTEEITLPPDRVFQELAYDPVNNSLNLVCQTEKSCQLLTLSTQNKWIPTSQWKIPEDEELLHFVYGTDGKLYACRQKTDGKNDKQTFVRLKKNGTVSTVPLRALNDVPETFFDKRMKKKGDSIPHDITDIRFSGTALAVTYRNCAVKFYNIAEGGGLGATSVTGEASHNAFYNYHYLSSANPASSDASSLILTVYDIRTGEKDHTIRPAISMPQTAPFLISNYREQLWLLSEDGLFAGHFSDTVLRKILAYDELDLPEIRQLQHFQVSRDNIIYIAYLDDNESPHLIRFTAPVVTVQSLTNGQALKPTA